MDTNSELPNSYLKKWTVLENADEPLLRKIVYFVGFQTYTDEESERKDSALFLTSDDDVYAVGHNNSDNLLALTGDDFGRSFTIDKPRKIHLLSGKRIKKMTVNERFGAALTFDGKMLYWGMDMKFIQYEERDMKYVKLPYEPRSDLEITDITCGAHSITLVTSSDEVFIWGCINLYYSSFYDFQKLRIRKSVKIQSASCGWYHVALLDQTGQVWTFGYGSVGQLGYKWSSQGNGYVNPAKVGLPGPCEKVECGAYSTLFLLKSGEVYACGSNSESDYLCVGASGYVFKPIKVQLDQRINDIAATYAWFSGKWQSLFGAHSKSNNEFFKWGDDQKLDKPESQKGVSILDELFANFKTPQSLGELEPVDSLNKSGVGLIKLDTTNAGKSVMKKWSIFDQCDELFIDRAEYFTVFSTFDDKTVFGSFVVDEDDDLYKIGDFGATSWLKSSNEITKRPITKVRELSKLQIRKILASLDEGMALSKNGTLYSWSQARGYEGKVEVDGSLIKDITGGLKSFLYLTETGQLYFHGILSVEHEYEKLKKITLPQSKIAETVSGGGWHYAILTASAEVFTFGHGIYHQLGYESHPGSDPYEPKKVELPFRCVKVVCGVTSTFFLSENGHLYACGNNTEANPLGVGHWKTVFKPEKVLIDEPVVDVAASFKMAQPNVRITITAAKTSSGKIFKWGAGQDQPTVQGSLTHLIEAFDNVDVPSTLSLVAIASTKKRSIAVESEIQLPIDNLSKLFGDPLYSDVTIKLSDGTLPAHKIILYQNSAFFRSLLSSRGGMNQNELDLTAYNPKALKALLKNIYGLPIGGRGLLKDVTDLHDLAEKEESSKLLHLSKHLLAENLLHHVASEYLQRKLSPVHERALDIILPNKPFP